MATITARTSGNFRGKMDNTIFCRWKKLYVAKKLSTRRKNPKETPPLPQVQKVKLMSHFLRHFSTEIKKGFYKKNSKHSTWTLALKYNLEKAIMAEGETYAIDYKNVRIADGNLEGAWAAKIYFEAGCTVRITWQMSSMAKHTNAEKDKAWVVLYNHTDQFSHNIQIVADRGALTCSYRLGSNVLGSAVLGDTYHAWIFFLSPDGKQVSTSDYIGGGVLIA